MYCQKCDLEIKNDELKVCPYCGSALIPRDYSRDFSDIDENSNLSPNPNLNPYNNQYNPAYDEYNQGFSGDEYYEDDYYREDGFDDFEEEGRKKKKKKDKAPMDPKKKKIMIIVFIIIGVILLLAGALAVLFALNNNDDVEIKTTVMDSTQPIAPATNTVGNSVGNIVNRGLATEQNGYIYYVVKEIDYSKKPDEQMQDSAIYRMRADGSEITFLCNANAEFLNVMGDYLYFSNLDTKVFCRINTDGSDFKTLYPHDVSYVTVTQNYIYFIDNDTFSLNRMNLDGTGAQRLIEDSISFFTIVGDQIFYKLNIEDSTMNACDLEGQNQVTLEAYVSGIPIIKDKDNLYCNNGSTMVYRTTADATGETTLYNDILTGSVNITDTNIYLSGGTLKEGQIKKIDLTGVNGVAIYPRDAKCINVVGDFLFCLDKDDITYVVRNDGSGFVELSKPRDKKSEAYIKSLIENETTENILSFHYLNYDVSGDNSHEAYAFVGRADAKNNCYNGEIWFANTEKAVKIREKESYTSTGEILTFSNKMSYFKIEAVVEQKNLDYVYGVAGGQPKETGISGKGTGLEKLDNDVLSLYYEDYDSSIAGAGYTKKKYYFFHDNNGFHEFGGLKVDRASFEKINGAAAILSSIETGGKKVTDIYYRLNGTFAVNFIDGEWQSYYILSYGNGSLVKTEDGEGFYKSAIAPKIAIYPKESDFSQLVP
jgi:hypothetical protein